MIRFVPILFFFCFCCVWAEDTTIGEVAPPDSEVTTEDVAEDKDEFTDALKKMLEPITIETQYDQGKLINLQLAERRRDPTTAMIRSMLVPGWGQFYNNKPWKGYLAIAAEGTCVTLAIYNYRLMQDYRNRSQDAYRIYRKLAESEDEAVLARADEYKSRGDYDDGKYEYFTIEFEKNLWLFIGCVFLSSLDAYIDAHLSDFDIYDLPRDPNPNDGMSIPVFGMSWTLW